METEIRLLLIILCILQFPNIQGRIQRGVHPTMRVFFRGGGANSRMPPHSHTLIIWERKNCYSRLKQIFVIRKLRNSIEKVVLLTFFGGYGAKYILPPYAIFWIRLLYRYKDVPLSRTDHFYDMKKSVLIALLTR